MISNRNVRTTLLVCLAVLVVAIAIRTNQLIPKSSEKTLSYADSLPPPIPDPSFLESGQVDGKQNNQNPTDKNPKAVGIPGITAKAYLVENIKTNQVYFEFNSKSVLPVASMSKLVTAFVATDILSGSSTVEISSSSLETFPDKSNLQLGEKFTLDEILYPLLLDSSNIAAEALSSSTIKRSEFLEAMKSYSWEIGMPGTYFADPSGISPQNKASAQDLFALSRYLVNYRPDILDLTRIPTSTLATTTDHGSHVFTSTHPFVNDPRFIGGKTGRTEQAGETMMTIMKISGQPVAIIILGALNGNRENDTRILLNKVIEKIGTH